MGKCNVNVSLNDGLLYVSYDTVNVYKSKDDPNDVRIKANIPDGKSDGYAIDLDMSQAKYEAWLIAFRKAMSKRYKSYRPADQYDKKGRRIILENDMFQVAIEDNEWSFAVELLSNPKYPHVNFQRQLFRNFFKGMRQILLSMADAVYVRTGSWTARKITADNQAELDAEMDAARVKIDPKAKPTEGFPRKIKASGDKAPAYEPNVEAD